MSEPNSPANGGRAAWRSVIKFLDGLTAAAASFAACKPRVMHCLVKVDTGNRSE